MTSQRDDAYLWLGQGPADPTVQELESALQGLAFDPLTPVPMPDSPPGTESGTPGDPASAGAGANAGASAGASAGGGLASWGWGFAAGFAVVAGIWWWSARTEVVLPAPGVTPGLQVVGDGDAAQWGAEQGLKGDTDEGDVGDIVPPLDLPVAGEEDQDGDEVLDLKDPFGSDATPTRTTKRKGKSKVSPDLKDPFSSLRDEPAELPPPKDPFAGSQPEGAPAVDMRDPFGGSPGPNEADPNLKSPFQ